MPFIGSVISTWAKHSENGLFTGALTSFIQTKVVGLEVLTRLTDADSSQALSDHCHDAGTFACCLLALSRTPLIIQPGINDTPILIPCRRHAWSGRSVATAKHQLGLLLSLHPPPHASQSLGLQALATTPGELTKFISSYIFPSHKHTHTYTFNAIL
uniref:Secreted protein n=1 Tax=Loa loa TaxID=7209 RepID=A0A1I7V7U8_LOALO